MLAFEPSLPIYRRLLANLALNPGVAVEPHMIGLGDVTDRLTFYQPAKDYANQGTGTFDRSFAPDRHVIVDLPVERGDAVLVREAVTTVDAIKIDVQGFELRVIAGLGETIARDRPAIWFEVSGATLVLLAAMGGLATLLPEGYVMLRFVSRPRLGLVHVMRLEPVAGLIPPAEGDYVVIPEEWPVDLTPIAV